MPDSLGARMKEDYEFGAAPQVLSQPGMSAVSLSNEGRPMSGTHPAIRHQHRSVQAHSLPSLATGCWQTRHFAGGAVTGSVTTTTLTMKENPVITPELRAKVTATRAAQGLPPVVTDPATLERVAAVFRLVSPADNSRRPRRGRKTVGEQRDSNH